MVILKTCGEYVEECTINGGGEYPLEEKNMQNSYYLREIPKSHKNLIINGENFLINEYVAHKIFSYFQMEVEEVKLVKENNKLLLYKKNFLKDSEKLIKFSQIRNEIISREKIGYGTELNDVLYIIENQKYVNKDEFLSFFWKLFVVDGLVGNFDRNIGKFGLIKNEKTLEYKIAPVFDNNTTLFPQVNLKEIGKDRLNNKFYIYPNSTLKIDNKLISYYEYLKNTKNVHCLKAIEEIKGKINIFEIDEILNKIPYTSKEYKEFLKGVIKIRYEKIFNGIIKV